MERLFPQVESKRKAPDGTPIRRLVARNSNDLYYQKPDLVRAASLDLGNGWWLGTNLSTADIQKKIKIACEVAGIKFGSQLTLIER